MSDKAFPRNSSKKKTNAADRRMSLWALSAASAARVHSLATFAVPVPAQGLTSLRYDEGPGHVCRVTIKARAPRKAYMSLQNSATSKLAKEQRVTNVLVMKFFKRTMLCLLYHFERYRQLRMPGRSSTSSNWTMLFRLRWAKCTKLPRASKPFSSVRFPDRCKLIS